MMMAFYTQLVYYGIAVIAFAGVGPSSPVGPHGAHAAPGVFDMFSWGLDQIAGYDGVVDANTGLPVPVAVAPGAKSDAGTSPENRCTCEGSSCQCCIDMRLAYIDVGGPSCVYMKYVSPDEGLKMNISYGDSLLHGAVVNASNPGPVCMDLLSDLAQVCASMKNLRSAGDGLKGCASLEPAILGDIQAEYPLGCFKMGTTGMTVDEEEQSKPLPDVSPEPTEETAVTTVKPDINEEALIAAVNESAEEGIAWFSSLLGFSFGGNEAGAGNSTDGAGSGAPNDSSPINSTYATTAPGTVSATLTQASGSAGGVEHTTQHKLQQNQQSSEVP